MTRIQADLALGLAGLIWGFGFVAQKTALDHIGPFTFVALRFLISALFVLPWAWRENGLRKLASAGPGNARRLALFCAAFAGAVLFQQYGLTATSVTNTAFLTELYIVIVPFVAWLFYRQKLTWSVAAASLLSLGGVWLLAAKPGMAVTGFSRGDLCVLISAFAFAVQVVVIGALAQKLQLPFTMSVLQYSVVAAIAALAALVMEPLDLAAMAKAWQPLLYAGIASGGIAYTLQAIAQQHTPSSEAAIIMSSEALFGGIGGVWLMHEPLTARGALGWTAIIASVVLVESRVWRNRRLKPGFHKV